jgi:hypothetical protein
MKLVGTHTGWFEAEYVMEIPEDKYNNFIKENPDYDMEDDPDLIWQHFKDLGYDDEIENSCDYDTVLREVVLENE